MQLSDVIGHDSNSEVNCIDFQSVLTLLPMPEFQIAVIQIISGVRLIPVKELID